MFSTESFQNVFNRYFNLLNPPEILSGKVKLVLSNCRSNNIKKIFNYSFTFKHFKLILFECMFFFFSERNSMQ